MTRRILALFSASVLAIACATGAPSGAPVAAGGAGAAAQRPAGSADPSDPSAPPSEAQFVSPGLATVPVGLDLYVPFPPANPMTPAKVELGRKLFFETEISADGNTACASCHEPERVFTDGRRVPTGVYGRRGRCRV